MMRNGVGMKPLPFNYTSIPVFLAGSYPPTEDELHDVFDPSYKEDIMKKLQNRFIEPYEKP